MGPATALFWVKKIADGRNVAGQAIPPPSLSSRSGSATATLGEYSQFTRFSGMCFLVHHWDGLGVKTSLKHYGTKAIRCKL